ncbi:MAG TPA: LLM class flavin-dependent oxidoreductase [Blastocatellia bacterium]|nr:LLM class flavin-dependent oxidoreductase [Blastocatellia bacterium]
MQYAFAPQIGDAKAMIELAVEAEKAGWDGFFIPDALAPSGQFFDPWVLLSAIAMKTERIRIGTMITAVSRRRPWKLARETGTLDQLSNGRLILSVGLGAVEYDGGFSKVGEPTDLKTRAQLLDEGLEIMAGLWGGKPYSFKGEHYRVDDIQMLPASVQKPRIPVWVVGVWPKEKSMRRALRWDGVIPQKYKATASDAYMKPDEIRALKDYVKGHHAQPDRFDIIAGGITSGRSRKQDAETVRPFIEAGATWWVDSIFSSDAQKIRARIRKGPPRP